MKVLIWTGQNRKESRSHLLHLAWPLVAGISERSCRLEAPKNSASTDDIFSLVPRMFRLYPNQRLGVLGNQGCGMLYLCNSFGFRPVWSSLNTSTFQEPVPSTDSSQIPATARLSPEHATYKSCWAVSKTAIRAQLPEVDLNTTKLKRATC